MAQGAKVLIYPSRVKLHLRRLVPGEATVTPPRHCWYTADNSYQLFTITSSINVCVFGQRSNNQSESLLSLPLRSDVPMAQTLAGLPGADKEKRFSSHKTGWLA